jgi:hypothetical protein
MNCNDINQALIEGSIVSPLLPEVEAHLGNCARCRELVGALSVPVPGVSPSPATLRDIERAIVADLRPVQPIVPKLYIFGGFIVIFVSMVAVGVYRMGAFALAVMSPLQAAVILGVLAISAGFLAYSLVNQMVPGSLHRIPPGLLPFGIMISLAIAIAVSFRFQHEQNFWANGWTCIRAGTPIGALAAVPLWFVLRRGAILSPAMTGAATGLLAGLVGTTALEIHCPNLDAWHILVAHLGVAALGTIAGFLFGLAAGKHQNNLAEAVTRSRALNESP